MRWVLLFLVIFGGVNKILAQTSQRQCKYITTFGIEFPLDSLSVLPSSIEFPDNNSNTLHYEYNPNTGNIFIEKRTGVDSIEVCYSTIPIVLHKSYSRHDLAEIEASQQQEDVSEENKGTSPIVLGEREELFDTEGLNKSGSLSRGVSFGNSQNVVVNSNLNLQLDGKLTDEVNIRASITDQNIPYQPEGNTAQIQDIDNVFIELYNDNFSLIGGDVVLQNKESHFLRYYKNVQGGMLNLSYKTGKNGSATTSFGASVAKGKFASLTLEAKEGVAGPYRMEIPDASRIAIIIANSEKVYIDGKQLQRGDEYDYIIDYDKAEITFTSRILITQYTRIRIDVEYSDQNYGRGIMAFNHYQEQGKVNFFLNYYSEKDNRNNPLKFDLSNDDKNYLSEIGDDLDMALKQGYQEAEFNSQKIQYELLDTLDNDGVTHQVFRYSSNQALQLYDVNFTEVGQGEGDYIRSNDLLNGVVFKWVSPLNGQPQGNYIPAQKISPPNKKSMLNGGVSVGITKYEKVFSEIAYSTNDLNLYSDIDNDNNEDLAYWVGYKSTDRPLAGDYKINSGFSYERNGKYFNPIDRFRYIEFERDWNYNPDLVQDQTADNIIRADFSFSSDPNNLLGYELVNRNREGEIDGVQHKVNFNKNLAGLQFTSSAFVMRNQSSSFHSSWDRISIDLNYPTKIWVPGYTYSIDRNIISDPTIDSVISTAMNYKEHLFYVRSNDTLKTKFRIDYSYREDQLPIQGELELSNIAHTSNFLMVHNGRNQRFNALITYRKSQPKNSVDKQEETINTRIDWYANVLNRHVRSDLSYAVGSGRELRKEFVFIEVPTGQGTHTWRDDNGNGIQELNEFYLAVNPDEKNFAKIFVPTSEFVFAHLNNFNYRLNLEMPRNWQGAGGVKGFLTRWSNISSLSSQRKITDKSLQSRFLPFGNNIKEEDLISSRLTFGTRFFFNRKDPRFGFDVGLNSFDNKQLLSQGFERRTTDHLSFNFRSNIKKVFGVNIQLKDGNVVNSSDFLVGKNFNIQFSEISPQLSWQPSVHFRISTSYSYKQKNTIDSDEDEYANINEGTFAMIYNKSGSISFNAHVKMSSIEFSGNENSPVGYELLEALRPGNNYLWNFVLQKKLIAGLQLSANYEGRKSAGNPTVHIGRMQVSVLF